jgi:hypothetical protein
MAVWLVIGSKCSEVRPIVSGIGTLILNRLVTIKSSTSLAGIQLVGVDKVFFQCRAVDARGELCSDSTLRICKPKRRNLRMGHAGMPKHKCHGLSGFMLDCGYLGL